MMILQGVGHPVPYLGVLYANDPKKGVYMAYAPALDLTTLFEVIYKWLPHPAFLGAQKGAGLRRNPCILGGPQRQARREI